MADDKKLDLKEVLDYINTFYLDEHMYLLIPHLYDDRKFEFRWYQNCSEPRWMYREKPEKHDHPEDDDKWKAIHTEDLLKSINDEKIDLIEFHSKIVNKSLINIAYLHGVIQKGKAVFGEELIETSIEELEEFYKQLATTIKSYLPKKEELKKKKTKKKTKKKEQKEKSNVVDLNDHRKK